MAAVIASAELIPLRHAFSIDLVSIQVVAMERVKLTIIVPRRNRNARSLDGSSRRELTLVKTINPPVIAAEPTVAPIPMLVNASRTGSLVATPQV